ncbi:hypothetical protein KC357_g9178 [Hortaea werneckii]|nr:hypothetical protein KC357_g9178 [Hortaea werneckii]
MAKCIRLSSKISKLAHTAHQRLGQQLREGQGLEGNYDVYNTFYVDKYREYLVDLLKQAEEDICADHPEKSVRWIDIRLVTRSQQLPALRASKPAWLLPLNGPSSQPIYLSDMTEVKADDVYLTFCLDEHATPESK